MPIDQITILKKLQAYTELKYRLKPEDARAEVGKLLAGPGYCSGLTGLYLYRKKREQESQFFGNLALISEWDEKEESLRIGGNFLEKVFAQTINDLRWIQDESIRMLLAGVKQKDLVDIFETTKPATKSPALAEEFSLSFVCKDDAELKILLENTVSKNTDKLIYFAGGSVHGKGHVVGIMPKKEVLEGKPVYRYYVYDPNSPTGEIIFNNLDDLQILLKRSLFESFEYPENVYHTDANQKKFSYMPILIQILDESNKATPDRYKKSSTEIAGSFLEKDNDWLRILYTLMNAMKYDDLEMFYFIVNNSHVKINNKILKECLKDFEDQYTQVYSRNFFQYAAGIGAFRILSYLLSERSPIQIDVNSKDLLDKNALQLAVESNQFQCVLLLLQNKELQVNNKDYQDTTALHMAVKNRNLAIVNLLLNRPDINVNLKDTNYMTPLTLAIKGKDTDLVRAIAKNKNLQILSHEAQTVFQMALESGSTEIIRIIFELLPKDKKETALIEEGEEGKLPIFYAIESQDDEIKKYFKDKLPAKSLHEKNSRGITPLMFGISHLLKTEAKSSHEFIDNLLFSPKADLDAFYPNGDTMYTAALMLNNTFVSNRIIEAYKRRGLYTEELQKKLKSEEESVSLRPIPTNADSYVYFDLNKPKVPKVHPPVLSLKDDTDTFEWKTISDKDDFLKQDEVNVSSSAIDSAKPFMPGYKKTQKDNHSQDSKTVQDKDKKPHNTPKG